MKDWPQVRLADAFRLEMGKTPDRGNTAYWNSNRKWASIADIGRSGMFLVDTKEKISDRAIAETGIKSVPANTIVMSFKLSIGKTAITKDELFTNEAIMAFHPLGPKLFDLHFLYHLFSNKDWAAGCNKAVKGVTLNKATLREVRILCPPLEAQEQMAKVLDGICAIVEQTQNQIAKLDQLVKSRFVEAA